MYLVALLILTILETLLMAFSIVMVKLLSLALLLGHASSSLIGVLIIDCLAKNVTFHYSAINQSETGRKKVYSEQLPTTDEIRQSDNFKWHKINAWAAGKNHEFNIKVMQGFIWRKTGGERKYRLIVIRPLGYKLYKKSKLLYRAPAYLLCTDIDMSLQDTLQFYLWSWEIEVNIGEGKSLFGVGQAHVRNPKSIEIVPAFITAIYSLLLLANLESSKSNQALFLSKAK